MKKNSFAIYPHSVRELRAEIIAQELRVDDLEEEVARFKALYERLMEVPGVEALWLGALRRQSHPLWPELPNGEGVAQPGLTESEVLQGREAPPGCEPDGPGDGLPRDLTDPRD